jgi:parallel beta-helix repeat protein
MKLLLGIMCSFLLASSGLTEWASAAPITFSVKAKMLSGELSAMTPIHFTLDVAGGERPFRYMWDFNSRNGQQVEKFEKSPSFVFEKEGDYQVTATVIDASKAVRKSTATITVEKKLYKPNSPISLVNIHGTPENPVVIKGLELTAAGGNAIEIIDSSYVQVEDNYIHDVSSSGPQDSEVGFAIKVKNSNNIVIARNRLVNNARSVYVYDSNDSNRCFQNTVADNFISKSHFAQGLMFRGCSHLVATNNVLSANGKQEYFERNRITGIIAWDSSEITFSHNLVTGSSSDGIGVAVSNERKQKDRTFSSYNAEIYRNVVRSNGEQGVWIEGLTNGDIRQNYIANNTNPDPKLGSSGIMLELENFKVRIHKNLILNNEIAGVGLISSSENEIFENIIESNQGPGVEIRFQESDFFMKTQPDNNYIHNNIIARNAYGAIVHRGSANRFLNNTFAANLGDSVTLQNGAIGTVVVNNIISGDFNQHVYNLGVNSRISNNLLFGDATQRTKSEIIKDSLIGNPGFVNSRLGDFRLKAGSSGKSAARMKFSPCSRVPTSNLNRDLGAFCLRW